ncbi:hypothetical protein COU79_03860 [Candidatus Peregrinibacteria bacterium CG10_big_fil_rev_8_21_14_0_10_54_7]|nr:MAG: hypothetical protein COU79_03860 [Candidatus Peregrinibacteria bacterium CG10_big_fil_rev_8_21_14_0_10_54_7]
MDKYYVYLLRCGDGSYYTGVTSNLELRMWQHRSGAFPECYTRSRRPVELVYSAEFGDINEAIVWEKQVKKWSRKKKEALIEQNWHLLSQLSQCENGTNHTLYSTIVCHAERSRSTTHDLLHASSLDYARDDIGGCLG